MALNYGSSDKMAFDGLLPSPSTSLNKVSERLPANTFCTKFQMTLWHSLIILTGDAIKGKFQHMADILLSDSGRSMEYIKPRI